MVIVERDDETREAASRRLFAVCLFTFLVIALPGPTEAGPPAPESPEASALAEGQQAFLAGCIEEAEAIWRAGVGAAQERNEPAVEAALRRSLALVERGRGRFAAARHELDKAIEADRAAGNTVAAAQDQGLAAQLHLEMGDLPEADALQDRALPVLEPEGASRELAAALLRSARIKAALLQDGTAAELVERAHSMSEELGDLRGAAEALLASAHLSTTAQRYDQALACLERAVAIATSLGDHGCIGRVLAGTAAVHRMQGDTRRALEFQERALAMFERAGDGRTVVSSLVSLGLTRLSEGDAAGAQALYEQARTRAEALEAEDLLVRGWWGEARAHLLRGESQDAAAAARRAVEKLPGVFGSLSEEQGAAVRSGHGGVFETGAEAAAALSDPDLLCFFLESGRAGTLLEFLGEREALQAVCVRPELLEAEAIARREEADAFRAYREARELGGRARVLRARRQLDAARSTLKGVLERIQRETKVRAGALLPQIVSLARIQQELEDHEVFVLYALFPAPDAIALVVERASARIVRLGPVAAIEQAYEGLDLDDASTEPGPAMDALRALAFEPLQLGRDVRRVLVSPDGILSYVPGGVLIPDREVVFTPSGTTWCLLRQARQPGGQDVLALGDPVYGRPDQPSVTTSVRSGVDLARLPFTREEALAVGDVVLLGADATEAGLRYAVSRRKCWRAIHFACHGVVDPDTPSLSALALTPDSSDDGFLTALDVFRLRLPADLVVLSACDSGVGRIVNAEGVLGLMRAFLFAGSPRVLVSLGRVDDRATRALMETFYRELRGGLPAAQALGRAQDEVRRQPKWAHPHYWASWVLWGLP